MGSRLPAQGNHYFSLVERLADGSQVVLPCIIWNNLWPRIRQKLLNAAIALASGQEMLFQGTVQLYSGAGKLSFRISDVYPEFTLGQIEAQRRAVLARLQRENLIGLNRRVEMPAVPLRVAVLSSRSAAGLRDFEEVLSQSGYSFSVLLCEVPVQGPTVERSVCRALHVLARKQREIQLDAVCIVRGGGSATDLGWWNSYAICAAIARMTVPVITGIGHERDRVAADAVAHTAAPTPTAAAELLCSLARNADNQLRETTDRMAAAVVQRLAGATGAVEAIRRTVAQKTTDCVSKEQLLICSLREQCTANARRALAPHTDVLRRFHETLQLDTGRALRRELAEVKAEVQSQATREIGQSRALLVHLADLVQAYDPVHVLRRGFSITFDAQGKAVKSAADLAPGETINTRLAEGQLASTITQTS